MSLQDMVTAAYYEIQGSGGLDRRRDQQIRRLINAIAARWRILVAKAKAKVGEAGNPELTMMEDTLSVSTTYETSLNGNYRGRWHRMLDLSLTIRLNSYGFRK